MATGTENELALFHAFVGEQLASGNGLTPESSLEVWRASHPPSEELEESVAALNAALADMAAGDHGRPATEMIADLRKRHGLN